MVVKITGVNGIPRCPLSVLRGSVLTTLVWHRSGCQAGGTAQHGGDLGRSWTGFAAWVWAGGLICGTDLWLLWRFKWLSWLTPCWWPCGCWCGRGELCAWEIIWDRPAVDLGVYCRALTPECRASLPRISVRARGLCGGDTWRTGRAGRAIGSVVWLAACRLPLDTLPRAFSQNWWSKLSASEEVLWLKHFSWDGR